MEAMVAIEDSGDPAQLDRAGRKCSDVRPDILASVLCIVMLPAACMQVILHYIKYLKVHVFHSIFPRILLPYSRTQHYVRTRLYVQQQRYTNPSALASSW